MAHGPTRKALGDQIKELQNNGDRLARENDMLRKEVEYAHAQADRSRAETRFMSIDRERLTGVVEILARRLASDGVNQMAEARTRIDESAKVPYPRH